MIDTSSILKIKKSVPRVARSRCLGGLSALVASGHLVYPRQVVEELERGSGGEESEPWFLWAKKHQKHACRYATDLQRLTVLLKRVHLVVDTEKTTGVEQADPYVIELAVGIMEGGLSLTRFGGHRSKRGYGVEHGRGEEAEAATAELHRRLQSWGRPAGAGRGQDHPAGGA